MARFSKTPTFVCSFATVADRAALKLFDSRLEAGRQLYNAALGESTRRAAAMRRDPAWAKAKAIPKAASGPGTTKQQKAQKKARVEVFKALREKYGFTSFSFFGLKNTEKHPDVAKFKLRSFKRDCWLAGHLDSCTANKIVKRAFEAVERWSFGRGGKPRFKRHGELESLEGIWNESGIRLVRDNDEHVVEWKGKFGTLCLPLIVRRTKNDTDPVQAHAIAHVAAGKFKFVRLVSKAIRGKKRVEVHILCDGAKHQKPKNKIGPRNLSLDLGPSQVAVVAEPTAAEPSIAKVFKFCEGLDPKAASRRRYQRRIDRQRRANNPENYNADGTSKKGRLAWKKSKRQKKTEARLAETDRKLAAHRKSLQGELVNDVLAAGNQIKTEKVSLKAWQTQYGKSIGLRAPGMFQSELKRKATASGGSFDLINTWTTYLSSRCLCGKRTKKTRSELKHTCDCGFFPTGTFAGRNEFSAFLAMFCPDGKTLDEQAARLAWAAWGAECLLRSSSGDVEAASGSALHSSRPRRRGRQSGLIAKGRQSRGEARRERHCREIEANDQESRVAGASSSKSIPEAVPLGPTEGITQTRSSRAPPPRSCGPPSGRSPSHLLSPRRASGESRR